MSRAALGLLGVMSMGTLGGAYASMAGVGLPDPEKQPISIREGTPRQSTGYFRSDHYRGGIVGGGMFMGK